MCDENASYEHDSKTDAQLSLLDLPIEIFLHICSFLDTSTLAYTLSPVCKQFYIILRNNSLWKARVNHMWKDASYPILPLAKDNNLFWRSAWFALQKERKLWECKTFKRNFLVTDINMDTMCMDTHSGYIIDSLLLMHGGTTCICAATNTNYINGGTNCSLVYCKLRTQENEREKTAFIEKAHNGRIWDQTAIDNTIYSCNSKGSIKSWMLANTGYIFLKTYETDSSLKCISSCAEREDFVTSLFNNINSSLNCISSCAEQEVFATSSYKNVFVFDTRFDKPIAKYHPHSRSVIKLAMNSSYILSAGTKLTIWDQRARKILRHVNISENASPTCMSMHRDWVYVGDSVGKLHVLNPKDDFTIVKSYDIGHKDVITGVHQSLGCLITGSRDGEVRISSPTDPPKCLATLTFPFRELTNMDYQNGVLAISGSPGIKIWRPKLMHSNKDQ